MANEITITSSLKFAKSKVSVSLGTSFTATQVGDKYQSGIQSIGFAVEESLDKGDIGTIGYLSVRNMDTDNFVELGKTTGVYTIKLLPGEGTVVPWKGTGVFAKADTAAVEVEYLAIEA